MSGRRALLVYNPAAGHGKVEQRIETLRTILRSAGFEIEKAPTTGPGQATEIAQQARQANLHEVVFTAGGDGTLREVAAGLLGGDLPLAILPAGTTNVLALALGIPRNPIAAARAFSATAQDQSMSVGLCNGEPFLMMVSCGFDAEVLAATQSVDKRRWGQAAVMKSAISLWQSYEFPQLTITEGKDVSRSSFAIAANIPWYGGPFEMAPRADPFADSLELISWHGASRAAFLSLALDVGLANHPRRSDITARTVRSLTIEGHDRVCYQLDGDAFWSDEALHIEMSEHRLPLLLPTEI